MPKKRLSDLSVELDVPIEQLKEFAKNKLADDMIKGPGNWVTEEGQKLLYTASLVPEVVAKHYSATFLHNARNKRFIFVKLNELGIKVPVLIPRKMAGRFSKEKLLYVEEIKDETGSSYRYVNVR